MIARLLLRTLGLTSIAELRAALDALHAARAEAELVRVQLEYAQQAIALLQMQHASAAMGTVWRVERVGEEMN